MLRIAVVAAATEGIVKMILRFECCGRTTDSYRSQAGLCHSSLRRGPAHSGWIVANLTLPGYGRVAKRQRAGNSRESG
jgi:hypothetical protein